MSIALRLALNSSFLLLLVIFRKTLVCPRSVAAELVASEKCQRAMRTLEDSHSRGFGRLFYRLGLFHFLCGRLWLVFV